MKKIVLFVLIIYSQHIAAQEATPYLDHYKNVIESLDSLGNPLSEKDKKEVSQLIKLNSKPELIEKILDKYLLYSLKIYGNQKLKATLVNANPELVQGGWRTFLVKIENQTGVKTNILIESEQAKPVYDGGEKIYGMGGDGKGEVISENDIKIRWLAINMASENLKSTALSGYKTEYQIIQLYSRDSGNKNALFKSFIENKKTNCSELSISFNCLSAMPVKLELLDFDQTPTTASLTIKNNNGKIVPDPSKRLAPDLFFESQIYRTSADTIYLPIGKYTIEYKRGAEYVSEIKNFEVTSANNQTLKLNLKRWINPLKMGYYSGDSHIHASGCSHYTSPTQGVKPNDMITHIIGEGVNVGVILVWGRGYNYQKQFFEGKDNKLSTKDNIMHYDMEISVFPSGHAGHLVLLNLKDQYYPKSKLLDDWPTFTIPILKWAKDQGAVNGYAHSGLGLEVKSDKLPNYELPKFDGIGANEYIVSVTQNLVDFISAVDTPPNWELNIWYHTLNCGFRTRIVGETDYPCITDDKVAHGRSYVKLDGNLNYTNWTEGLKLGKSYVSEGKSHLIDFKVNDVEVGYQNSEVKLIEPSMVKVTAKVAARLNEIIDPKIKPLDYSINIWDQKPFWDLERGRFGNTRTVPLELIVNGEVVETKIIEANGNLQDISFDTKIEKSSWIAIRILPSSHSNPIFVLVDNKPIRANVKSAEWCLRAVEVCWEQKKDGFSKIYYEEAKEVYEAAKEVYKRIIDESK